MLELLRRRRSVRKYQDQALDTAKVELIKEAALRSPSSRSLNPWELIMVDDKALLQALARSKPHGSAFLKDAALAVVVCGDETRSDVWVEDCSILSIVVQLACESVGVGSCWVQIRERMHDDQRSAESYVQELLGLPSHLRVESIISLGVPAESKPPHLKESLDTDKIHDNRYGR